MTHPLLDDLQLALDAARAGEIDTTALCRRLRAAALPPALPPAFGDVLGQLADRLESSALFGGESCSFSQADLLAGVQAWIDKARARLPKS